MNHYKLPEGITPLGPGRKDELRQVMGEAMSHFFEDETMTVAQLAENIAPYLEEQRCATQPASDPDELLHLCQRDQLRRGWLINNWPGKAVEHELQHIKLAQKTQPSIEAQLGFIHVQSPDESGCAVVNFPNLGELCPDRESFIALFKQAVGKHDSPSKGDKTIFKALFD